MKDEYIESLIRERDDLLKENAALKVLVEKLGDRCVGLVELVSKKAAKKGWQCPSCGKKDCDGYCTLDSWDFGDRRGG